MKFAVPALIVFGQACGVASSVVTIMLFKGFMNAKAQKKTEASFPLSFLMSMQKLTLTGSGGDCRGEVCSLLSNVDSLVCRFIRGCGQSRLVALLFACEFTSAVSLIVSLLALL